MAPLVLIRNIVNGVLPRGENSVHHTHIDWNVCICVWHRLSLVHILHVSNTRLTREHTHTHTHTHTHYSPGSRASVENHFILFLVVKKVIK